MNQVITASVSRPQVLSQQPAIHRVRKEVAGTATLEGTPMKQFLTVLLRCLSSWTV